MKTSVMKRLVLYVTAVALASVVALADTSLATENNGGVRKLLSKRNGMPRELRIKKKKKDSSTDDDDDDDRCLMVKSIGNESNPEFHEVEVEASLSDEKCPCCVNGKCAEKEDCEAILQVVLPIFAFVFFSVLVAILRRRRKRETPQSSVEVPPVTNVFAPGEVKPGAVGQPGVVYGQAAPVGVYGQPMAQPAQFQAAPAMQAPVVYGQPAPVGVYGQQTFQPAQFPASQATQFPANPPAQVQLQAATPQAFMQQPQVSAPQGMPAPTQSSPLTTLTVPPGYSGGKLLKVRTAEGQEIKVKIPDGCQPGSQFQIDLKAAAAASQ